ncbi:G-type lectin S-receptor-like serine/threonine-protein kinase At1g11330 [Salvia miltiorrhiza]|uniref:G-type lectin S-receptor-like serine/threonine-protein kinase At1g11330 n=1 Tax=Salvia miltiorrhiza TaxID=226208 RepID=UPI0025AC715F|nr:G-type lectin S-receptor-like serine/threonine-protein kinase At1g11330 [Salvia miltiorrhiza]
MIQKSANLFLPKNKRLSNDSESNNAYVWESFQHASDSWLEYMKIGTDLSRNDNNLLTSWTSPDDPAPGSFTFTIEPLDIPQSFIWKDGNSYWRTGPWNRQKYTGVQNMSSDYGYGVKGV